MSKPELDIIRSRSAEAFLRSVTKGFYNQSYTALWMYEVIGREWDELREWSEGMRDEIHPQTCTWSIPIWEWVYGFEPDESLTLEERRRRVLSKVFGTKPINPEVIRRGIEAISGIDTKVTDLIGPYAFGVTLYPNVEIMPDEAIPDSRIVRYVQNVKPAHLRVSIGIEVRREFRCTIPIAQGGAVGSYFLFEPVTQGHISDTLPLPISQAGAAAPWLTSEPPTPERSERIRCRVWQGGTSTSDMAGDTPQVQRTAHRPVSVAQAGFDRPGITSDTPEVKGASTSREKAAGGLFCHTHIKSKRID